jgi:hypothetical protein
MLHAVKIAVAVSIAGMLAACAGPVPRIDSSPEKLARIKTIAVITAPEPKSYTMANFGHPGMMFGLVGGLVAGSDMTSKTDTISSAYKGAGISVTARLGRETVERLNTAGYQARVELGNWEVTEGKYKLPFDKIQSDADAVLILSTTFIGYVATGVTSDYLPSIWSSAILLGKDRKEPLYRGFHSTGWQPKGDGWRYTPPKKTFGNFDALMTDPRASGTALEEASVNIAETVTADLKR